MGYPTKLALLLCFLVRSSNCAKILGVFLVPSVSHQIVYQPIWRELSLRGHQVTVITPNPLKDPTLTNLTEIDASSAYEVVAKTTDFSKKITHWDMVGVLSKYHRSTSDHILQLPEVTRLIQTNEKFDLVLVEFLNAVGTAFSAKFKCPFIGLASLSVTYVGHEAVGNPIHPILYPDMMTTFGTTLGFFERIESVLYYLWYRFHYYFVSLPKLDRVVKRHFGESMPYLGQIERNVSLLFLNTNPLIHKARALPPNVIELGRMHLKPRKPLPKDLQEFLDGAKEGVVYVSFGSNVKSAHIAPEKRKIFMETFSELPFKILWKFENDTLEGKPENVKISKWLPQQDLLGHPNVKMFVTQGGLQSMEEAIANNVPLVGIPFFADQFFNVERMQFLGIGRQVEYSTLDKKTLKGAIKEVSSNPKYKDTIRKLSQMLEDSPMTGLEKAIWWIEYVLRHKNVDHLKNPATNMPWYQFLLLDVIGFIITVLVLLLAGLLKILKMFGNAHNSSHQKKKKE